jgi:signal transduction histidine kinase
VILCAFAIAIGSLTVHRIRADFNRQVANTAEQIPRRLQVRVEPLQEKYTITPPLQEIASAGEHSVIRIMALEGRVLEQYPKHAPSLGRPQTRGARNVNGYRVVSLPVEVLHDNVSLGRLIIQYGRRVSDTEATVKRVELFLLLGVFGGSVFALMVGMAIARRAMRPIASLTSTAAEIARTRDPSRRMPEPASDDEVAELARTLQGMLRELDAARGETEAMLARQRRFVADASHELRTPLTSVLANLELLADSLHGEHGEAARSALGSSRRMRRLVADLLLLARTDNPRAEPREPFDLAQTIVEAAAELGPVSAEHEIVLDVHPAVVLGAGDELHRMTVNLIENAIRYTPPGSEVRVSTATSPAGWVTLEVADDGPGVPAEIAPTLFERFVRGAGDRGGSFGLGLAIVRAVARSHGGDVTLQTPASGRGASFVVRLPAYSDLDDDGQHHRPALEPVIDQLR